MATETSGSAAPEMQSAHALTHKRIPSWVNWVQDNLLMSCLIIAEAYLLGTLMVTGWVPNLETPGSWGIYSTIGVVVFFLAGATCAGVALRASFKAAICFERGQVKMGLINLVGCLVLCTCEFWANLTERATHLLPGLADIAVLHALGFGTSRISPTLIIVAVLLPVTTLFVGYTHFNESLPSQAERAARHRAKLDEIRQKAEERVARLQGYRGAAEAAFQRPSPETRMTVLATADTDVKATSSLDNTQQPDQLDQISQPASGDENRGDQAVDGTGEVRRLHLEPRSVGANVTPALPKPGTKAYRDLVRKTILAMQREGKTRTFYTIAQQMGAEVQTEDVKAAFETMRAEHLNKRRAGVREIPDPVLDDAALVVSNEEEAS